MTQYAPVAIVRAGYELRNPWILKLLLNYFGHGAKALDLGCGAGFLANYLAQNGFETTGVDLSSASLDIAKKYDSTHSVDYLQGDAYHLPFKDNTFNIVCAIDFLEHIDKPFKAIQEASRVLKPGGLFVFHTLNRTSMSWVFTIKFLKWLRKNSPSHIPVFKQFLKPDELIALSNDANLDVKEILGTAPQVGLQDALKMMTIGEVSRSFKYKFTSSTQLSFLGYAQKTI